MPRYNFTSLSSLDFEELIRDLLQAEWEVSLESFKSGRDGGIDLRYACANEGTTIIQCKHYLSSGFSKLLGDLRTKELPKIRLLKPQRYVVAASVALTPGNKKEITTALAPYVLSAHDVIGANDIEGLLSRHAAVERAHFKLWLTSTDVIERVLHNAEFCQTQFEIERIRKKLPLFVQNKAFPRAIELLQETRVAIISGVPGIGKTTLAEMILYSHLEEGYEPIVIKSEISEGKRLFKPDLKQVFYYDDFLGQTFLGDRPEYFGRNQDVAILDFIEMIRSSKNSRFVLTTREHILRAALQFSERLAYSAAPKHKCVLELKDYSYADRARILYNHLYFSDLSTPYRNAILRDDFFIHIIRHKHFNPRLIEWLSSETRLYSIKPDEYQAHISTLLDSPEKIWTHAFRNQISRAARNLLLVLYPVGERTRSRNLQKPFEVFHRFCGSKYHYGTAPDDFRNALHELDGAFLTYQTDEIFYLNPSIRDFIAATISNDQNISEDLIRSASSAKMLIYLWQLSQVREKEALRTLLVSRQPFIIKVLTALFREPWIRTVSRPDGTRISYMTDSDHEAVIGLFLEMSRDLQWEKLAQIAIQQARKLPEKWRRMSVDFEEAITMLEELKDNTWIENRGGRELYNELVDALIHELDSASANDWLRFIPFQANSQGFTPAQSQQVDSALKDYCESGALRDLSECSSSIDEMRDLRDALCTLSSQYGFNVTYEIGSLEERIAENDDQPRPIKYGRGVSSTRTTESFDNFTDDEARQMFVTLKQDGST